MATLLQPDGTLNLDNGYRGAVDPAGFVMKTEDDGTPVFVPLNGIIKGDENWQRIFGYPGANDEVKSVVMDGSGNLYIGGLFTTVGGVPANRVAMWDGSNWSALGGGLDAQVEALAVNGSELYAGGYFTTAGGIAASGIAKWNGSEWSALGSGISGGVWNFVSALAMDDSGNLYIGGNFTSPGNNVAKWDGSAWSTLSVGMDNSIYDRVLALAWHGGILYAGGVFTSAGYVTANFIAQWNGSVWSGVGPAPYPGFYTTVYALAVDSGGNLYAGGGFDQYWNGSAWAPMNYIAMWNGSTWSSLGTGMDAYVSGLAVDVSDNLYVGGSFSGAGGIPAAGIARWNGSTWSALGSGTGSANALLVDGSGNVFAGGSFDSAGGNPASRIAKWNGVNWSALATGGMGPYTPHVNALALDGAGNLYAGGDFTTAGAANASRVARWDGSSWSSLNNGIGDGEVRALACDSAGNLYVGGSFTSVDGSGINYIATWNGSAWSSMGTVFSTVHALLIDGSDTVYAGTNFSGAASSVVQWNGSNAFSGLGFVSDHTYALAMDSSGSLYAAGMTGNGMNGIGMWDGGAWSVVGSGISDGQVNAVVFDSQDTLFMGGSFTTGGGSPADYMAMWDGGAWSALGSGLNGQVRVLNIDKADNVYAGGDFTTAGGASANYIARWNGSSWEALGSGMSGIPGVIPEVRALAVDSDAGELFAGGYFNYAGLKESNSIAWLTGLPTSASAAFPWNLYLPAIIIKK